MAWQGLYCMWLVGASLLAWRIEMLLPILAIIGVLAIGVGIPIYLAWKDGLLKK